MQTRSSLLRGQCSICRRPIDVHQQVRGGICDDAACRAAAATQAIAKQEAAARAALEDIARNHLPALLAGSRLRAADVDLLALPGSDVVQHPPSPERREQFRQNVVAAVKNKTPVEAPAFEEPPAIAAPACAACRGLCCQYGGDSAFVETGVVGKIRARHPALDDAGIVAFLVESVPARTVEGSCILHGESGCALPRELRSDVCNHFHCRPLREWVGGTKPTAIVVADEQRAVRATLWRD